MAIEKFKIRFLFHQEKLRLKRETLCSVRNIGFDRWDLNEPQEETGLK